MTTFKQITESLNDNHLSDEEIEKFKHATKTEPNLKGMYDNFKKHSPGHVSYDFDGYIGSAVRKHNGKIHDMFEVDDKNKPKWKNGQTVVHNSIDDMIAHHKEQMDPEGVSANSHINPKAAKDYYDKIKTFEDLNEISDKLRHRYIDKATKNLDKNSSDYLNHVEKIYKLKATKSRHDEKSNLAIDKHQSKIDAFDVLGRKRQKSLEKALTKDTRDKPNPYR